MTLKDRTMNRDVDDIVEYMLKDLNLTADEVNDNVIYAGGYKYMIRVFPDKMILHFNKQCPQMKSAAMINLAVLNYGHDHVFIGNSFETLLDDKGRFYNIIFEGSSDPVHLLRGRELFAA